MTDKIPQSKQEDSDPIETQEWLESISSVLASSGESRVKYLLKKLHEYAHSKGIHAESFNTPYINTIAKSNEIPFPGDEHIEWKIRSLVRWNAMAMVVRANKLYEGLGGHISSFASSATLLEVAFNHFLKAKNDKDPGDQIYFQGHSSPGIYSRAFLEGRISLSQMEHFRRELSPKSGLSSYPHPWLMPKFWEFPTVSMGLTGISAIYQARFNRYLEHRGLKEPDQNKVWAFMGDGECDEPESLGALTVASRENLNNLIFVVNCNLQRLDGPVRGNGKIIQELETMFRGAGWNVIKVIWGADWDPLLANDQSGLLIKRMNEVVDGWYQKYSVESGDFARKHFFGEYPETLNLVKELNDEAIRKLRRGGHDPVKVYNAYHLAMQNTLRPTVILAKTIKGYGLGEAGEGKNVTHQQKKLNFEELKKFRDHYQIPISDQELGNAPFYRPDEDSEEIQYMLEQRRKLGGFVPRRVLRNPPMDPPEINSFKSFLSGSDDRPVSTTMAYVSILSTLLKDKEIGKLIVPIIPDEGRTFGMEPFFKTYGIYSSKGQLYEPVDSKSLLYYRESKDGQLLEEGITEAGSMASFAAAGTAYATHGINAIPFYTFYSMFGLQRTGDQVWQFGDLRGKGFLVGGTAGRTALNGEGLQHQDGHSHLLACTVPNLKAYDPAFAYEIAIIIQNGLKRMYQAQENIFYYLTVANENYVMPAMPEGSHQGILKGLYKFKEGNKADLQVHLFASGVIINEALKAQEILFNDYQISADVWSATSYKTLREDAAECERWNMLHPQEKARQSYLEEILANEPGPIIAASDYIKAVPQQIRPWIKNPFQVLGTDGFGRSDTREALRDHFEVSYKYIVLASLYQLSLQAKIDPQVCSDAIRDLGIDPEKTSSLYA